MKKSSNAIVRVVGGEVVDLRTLSIAIGAMTLAGTAPAYAQEAPAPAAEMTAGLQDIVVTARKREESVLDVPVAVTALGATDLNRYNASDLSKIAQLAPQVMIEKSFGGGGGAVISIRGISSSTLDPGLSSTVAVNIDGTQVSRGRIITAGFFDLQQVEVLKGPQALFFGKNSPGGVISLRSAGATRTLQSKIVGGYEFRAREAYLEGAVSGPISDSLGFRVAARGTRMAGWVHTDGVPFTLAGDPTVPHVPLAHDRTPRTREYMGRVTLDWHPSDKFSAVLKVFGTKYRDTGPNSTSEVKCEDPDSKLLTFDPNPFPGGTTFVDPAGDCRINLRRTNAALDPSRAAAFPGAGNGQPFLRYKALLSSLTMEYSTDVVDFTSVSSYYNQTTRFFDSFDFSSVGINFSTNNIKSRAFSQEFRANSTLDGPLNVMIGAFYESEKNPYFNNVLLFPEVLPSGALVNGRYDQWQLEYDSSGKSYSAFGQINYDILDNLELTIGARYTHETRKTFGRNTYLSPILASTGFFALVTDDPVDGKLSNSNVSPEVTLTYHPTRRTMVYAAYKTGFKSGGFSQPANLTKGFTAETLRFQPEKVRGFELGAKGQLLGNRLRVTGAVYRYKFTDLQVQTYDSAVNSYQVRNAAAARTTGVEVDAAYQATEELQLRAAAAYNRARFLSYSIAQCYQTQTPAQGCVVNDGVASQDLTGRPLSHAPYWNLSGGATYDMLLSSGLKLGLTGDARYNSSYWASSTYNPLGYQKGYVLLNASVRVHEADDKWELALIGRNLTNKLYFTNTVDRPFQPSPPTNQVAGSVGRAREIALQGTVRF